MTTALEVVRLRGYSEIERTLVAAGARAADVAPGNLSDWNAAATGIKCIDLWCPLPERGLVHLTPGFGLGAVVLVSELSHRAARSGRAVVWTGFVQAPTDAGDLRHGLAEAGLLDVVTVAMAEPSAPTDAQVSALDRGIDLATSDTFLVVFAETGRLQLIDELLPVLSRRQGVTLVVAPLDGSVAPPPLAGSPYSASIVFDERRAKRQQWPAISAASWSKAGDPDLAALADIARAQPSDALERYLCQPFFVAEPMIGRRGEHVSLDRLRREVGALVAPSGRHSGA